MDTRDLISIGVTLAKHRGLARSGLGVIAAVVIGIIVALPLYYTGLTPSFGYGDYRVKYSGHIQIPLLGQRKRKGTTIGFKKFYLFKGQTAFINYEVREIIKGGVKLKIAHNRHYQGEGLKKQIKVMKTGEGILQFKVPKNGFYNFSVRGTPKGKGNWDAYVSATWGARFGDPEPVQAIAKTRPATENPARKDVARKVSKPAKKHEFRPKKVLSSSNPALRTREPLLAQRIVKETPAQAVDAATSSPAVKDSKVKENLILTSTSKGKGFVVIGGDKNSR